MAGHTCTYDLSMQVLHLACLDLRERRANMSSGSVWNDVGAESLRWPRCIHTSSVPALHKVWKKRHPRSFDPPRARPHLPSCSAEFFASSQSDLANHTIVFAVHSLDCLLCPVQASSPSRLVTIHVSVILLRLDVLRRRQHGSNAESSRLLRRHPRRRASRPHQDGALRGRHTKDRRGN